MSYIHQETYDVLKWAKQVVDAKQPESGDENSLDEEAVVKLTRLLAYKEVAHSFWQELCKVLDVPESASPQHVYNEICAYGGNTIANFFRGGQGVPYPEVAYDVAMALKKIDDNKDFLKGDVLSCEKFVLKKMEVDDDVAAKVREQVDASVKSKLKETVLLAAGPIVIRQVAKTVAVKITQQITRALLLRFLAALNIVFTALLVVDLAGPATRKTIPAVIYVALLRQLYHAYNSEL